MALLLGEHTPTLEHRERNHLAHHWFPACLAHHHGSRRGNHDRTQEAQVVGLVPELRSLDRGDIELPLLSPWEEGGGL